VTVFLLKALIEYGYRMLQKFFARSFVTICDFAYFLYFTSVLNRLTYIGCRRTNNVQKLIASNHIRACQSHNACENYTLCVEIILERVVITLVSVVFTRIRVKITLV
jgi:hypothetical protein